MGEKKKFDFVSFSKKRGYRIGLIVALVLGLLLLGVGLIMRNGVSTTVLPQRLVVTWPSNLKAEGGNYTATIIYDDFLTVDTGTGRNALAQPIQFKMDEQAAAFLQPIPDARRAGVFKLCLKPGATNGASGTLTISCGSMPDFIIRFTYTAPQLS